MLINIFLNKPISFKDIEYFSNNIFLFISSYVIITNYYNIHYNISIHILKSYMLLDILFIPFDKFDMIIHHILTIMAIYYIGLNNIDVNTNFYALSQLYSLEKTNIFLGIMPFLQSKNTLLFLNQILFLICFLKFRIYDFYHNVVFNTYFYESLGTLREQLNYQYVVVGGIYALNIYWACILIKMACKPFLKPLKKYNAEYWLQYTYLMNTAVTAVSYFTILDWNSLQTNYSLIILDIYSNCLLAYSSYKFHNFWYHKLIVDENYNQYNHSYLKYLIFDVSSIHFRITSQIYCNMHMNNIYKEYREVYIYFILSSSIILPTIYILYNYCCDNMTLMSQEAKRKMYLIFQCLYGFPPAYGILLSIIPINGSYQYGYTIGIVYLIMVLMKVEPFYDCTQISIHLLMCIVNYLLVLNNSYSILRIQ